MAIISTPSGSTSTVTAAYITAVAPVAAAIIAASYCHNNFFSVTELSCASLLVLLFLVGVRSGSGGTTKPVPVVRQRMSGAKIKKKEEKKN